MRCGAESIRKDVSSLVSIDIDATRTPRLGSRLQLIHGEEEVSKNSQFDLFHSGVEGPLASESVHNNDCTGRLAVVKNFVGCVWKIQQLPARRCPHYELLFA